MLIMKTAIEDWFLILSDRETFDKRLVEVMDVLLTQKDVSAYSFYCVQNTPNVPIITTNMRLIKSKLELQELFLLPVDPQAKIVKILDGWIYEHDSDLRQVYGDGKNTKQLDSDIKYCHNASKNVTENMCT